MSMCNHALSTADTAGRTLRLHLPTEQLPPHAVPALLGLCKPNALSLPARTPRTRRKVVESKHVVWTARSPMPYLYHDGSVQFPLLVECLREIHTAAPCHTPTSN